MPKRNLPYLICLAAFFLLSGCQKTDDGSTTTVTVVPLAPTELVAAVVSTSEINLNWIDKSTNEDGFKVERKTASTNFTSIATIGKDISTYSDKGLIKNTIYTYRVLAYNTVGNSLTYTNEVSASTLDNDVTEGLVASYPFSGNAGDSSGNGYHGTVVGATLTSDRFGKQNAAYSFSPVSSSISIPILTPLSGASQVSYSFWRRNPAGLGIEANVFGFDNKYKISFGNFQPSKDTIYVWGSAVPSYAGSVFNKAANWNHIVIIYDGTKPDNTKYSVYQNGSLVAYLLGSGASAFPILSGTEKFFIQNTDVFANGKLGELDNFRIYKRVLTAAEISYLATH